MRAPPVRVVAEKGRYLGSDPTGVCNLVDGGMTKLIRSWELATSVLP